MNPLVLIAELTHRCPLRCAYCSNPLALVRRDAELDTAAWTRTLEQAAELGVVQVHFTGGEPLLREDLPALVGAATRAGVYSTLVTSGLGAGDAAACLERLSEAVDAGIRAVQVSFQDIDESAAAAVAGRDALARKLEFARSVRARGVSLTVNFVLHRQNLARIDRFIELALELEADRVELAHTQFHGWAEHNRDRLLPTRAQLDAADAVVARALRKHAARIELRYVLPDLFLDRPKPCMGGWGRRAIVVDPEGTALPCHGARVLPLAHATVREHSLAEIWRGPSFAAFRGDAWMEEPCRSCPAREHDFGGCRCQAFALTGRASATDPACRHAPEHPRVLGLRREAERGRPLRRMQLRTPTLMPTLPTSLRNLALIALVLAGCRTTERPQAETDKSPKPAPTSESDDADEPTAEALPARLADATPQNPLRPEAPKGPPVRNYPADPTDAPPELDNLKLPPGFAIAVYTAEVPHARSLALGPAGVVFVGTRDNNRVYAVIDKDRDYAVDEVVTIASGIDMPNGVAYKDGDLYVAQNDRIIKFPQIADRLHDPPQFELVSDALPTLRDHGWRYIRFGPDGRLYIPIGAPCNSCLRDEPIFATIARMRPDGSDFEVYASGVRNSVGLDWHPQTQELWFTDNGRDALGNDLPPDELNRASKPGMHFGYPYCHGGVILDPEFGEGRSCIEFTPPEQNLDPHVAALGMRFYTGDMFPARYRNAVILAERGSWNREDKIGYRVMVVPFETNEPAGYEPLVEGFLDPQSDEISGRPVDVEVLDDGSLLISDDWKGALYRVSYAAGQMQ